MMTMREAVQCVLTGRKMAARVGQQFVMDDGKLQRMGFTLSEVQDIRRHALEIEDMLKARMEKIPG